MGESIQSDGNTRHTRLVNMELHNLDSLYSDNQSEHEDTASNPNLIQRLINGRYSALLVSTLSNVAMCGFIGGSEK